MQNRFPGTFAIFAALAASGATPALAQDLDIGEVVVTANKTPTEKSKVGSTVYVTTKKDMDRQSLPSATDYLAQTPGISVASQGGAGHITTFFMRGLPGEYVKTFIDGIDVSDVTYTKTQAQFGQFLAGDLDRIEVLQGSQGALYGADAIAGVVNLSTLGTPEKGIHQRIYGEGGSRSTFLGGYSLNSGFDRGNFGVTIAGLTTNGFSTADSGTEKDGYKNLSGTIGGRFDVNENLSLFANGLFIKSNTDFDDGFGPPPDYLVADSDAHSKYRQAAGRVGADFNLFDGRLSNTIALQYSDISRDSVDGFGGLSTFDGTRTKIEYQGSFALTPTLTATFGADWERHHADTKGNFSGNVDKSESREGGWLQAIWTPIQPLTLTASVRQDEHSIYGGHTTWRATGSYNVFSTGTRFHSSVGTGYRAPSLYELYDPTYGNADLHPETSLSFDFGVEQRFLEDKLVADVTFFMANINDYIGYDPVTFQNIQTDGETRTRGVEMSLAYAPTSWLDFRGAYTYTKVTQPDGTRQVRVPRHAIGLSASVKPAEKWTVSATTRIALDTVDFEGVGKAPLDDYVLLDAKVSYKPTDATEIYLRGENLLNQKYEVSRGYGTPGLGVFAGFKATF
jgi:vitamin B12 transporter